ncbi:heme-binding protein [Mycobacterium sp. 852002-50816_SCH5313054-b]|uniref:SOUL family heme-binding protein n=1 Tax=Mycobacterium sp. 852002-50816_SCH5313054-b TaxID=1834092 RepID=UPI0007FF1EC3|nr:heme-binding protein [Mycobacterium sp. 852002-50816_SCH5313054-b]OBF60427.1 heme-binding protein [Mycobacterium sp. 852002-50816_SCH5313054-b]
MFGSVGALLGEVVDAAGSVVGYRHGTKEPDYSAEKLSRDVEIRRYGARVAAETTVTAGEEAARNAGFRRLARYIFGGNRVHEKIAMTAPVAQEAAGDRRWVIRFFMPADKTLESLPEPDDGAVRLVAVPPEMIAVHRFTGSRSRRAIAGHTAELMTTLREAGFEAVDTPEAWFYDPPWTVPALRRNEIAVPVATVP